MLASSLDGLISWCSTLPTTFAVTVLTPGGTPKSDAIPWAIVLFCVILGLLVSLNPSRRTSEIKHSKED
jgi:hypothetical protein